MFLCSGQYIRYSDWNVVIGCTRAEYAVNCILILKQDFTEIGAVLASDT